MSAFPADLQNRVVKNTVFLMGARLLSRLLQFFLFIYAARLIGVRNFGIFSFCLALVNLLSIAMNPGISEYVIQQLSRDYQKTPVYIGGNFVGISLFILPGFLLMLSTGFFMGEDGYTLSVLSLLALAMACNNLTMAYSAAFQAHERMEYPALINTACNFAMSMAGFLILYLFADLILFSIVYLSGAILRLFFNVYWCYRLYGRPTYSVKWSFVFSIIRKGLPFALVRVFVSIYYYIDTLMLKAWHEDAIVGYYNAAYYLLEGPLFVSESISTALFPTISRTFKDDEEEMLPLLRSFFEKAMVIGFSIAFAVALLSENIIDLVYGRSYAPASHVLPILIFTLALIMPNCVTGTAITAIDKQAVTARITGFGAILNLLLNFALIPKYSFIGAAWATLLTEILVFGFQVWVIRRSFGWVITFPMLLRLVAVNGGLFLFLLAGKPLGIWFQMIGCSIIILPLMTAFGVIQIAEIKKLIAKE